MDGGRLSLFIKPSSTKQTLALQTCPTTNHPKAVVYLLSPTENPSPRRPNSGVFISTLQKRTALILYLCEQ